MREDITAAYLDYVNNYLTLANFAASRGWSEITALTILKAGKELQDETIH